MKQEIYKSSTLGEIPLSFTGRHLLQNLREVITNGIAASANGQPIKWDDISIARGKLAQYISKLEQRSERPRAYDSHNEDEPRVHVHHVQSFEEVLKIMADYEAGNMPLESNGQEIKSTLEETNPKTQVHEAPNGSTLVLPEIPENYVLRMVGGMLVIQPLSVEELQAKADCDFNKRNNEKFYHLLNEYRDALMAVQIPGARRDWQEHVDKARMAIIQAYEKPL
jgi:hypothetical protein